MPAPGAPLRAPKPIVLVLLTLAGVAVISYLFDRQIAQSLDSGFPRNDFASFYAGPALLAEGKLYDAEASGRALESLGVAGSQNTLHFLRPPFYAWMLTPWRWFDYLTAYRIWTATTLLAFLTGVLLWGDAPGWLRVASVAWSAPLALLVLRGQDTGWVFLAMALGAWLCRRERDFAGGLVLALCAVKWHLALPLPLALIAVRRWRALSGFSSGAAALVAISFAVAGPSWPEAYAAAILAPGSSPHIAEMPNLRGFTYGLPGAAVWEIGLGAILALGFFLRGRALGVSQAIAECGALGLLISHHAYAYDAILVLPAAWYAVASQQNWMRAAGWFWISPLSSLCLLFPPWSKLSQFSLLAWCLPSTQRSDTRS